MRQEPKLEIFHQIFSLRIEIWSALEDILLPTHREFSELNTACTKLQDNLATFTSSDIVDDYKAHCTAATIFILLAEWRHSIRVAAPDSQRFLQSAKLHVSDIDRSLSFTMNDRLLKFFSTVENLVNPSDLFAIQKDLLNWPLPLPLFLKSRSSGLSISHTKLPDQPAENLDSTIAFLKFDIDGQPAKNWNYLKPGISYDLAIEVRVSNWPNDAHSLSLSPVTMDSRERNWLPSFRFSKPDGVHPFTFTATGRAVLEVAHSFGSRPYEFLYAAEFDQINGRQKVTTIGHRRLLLEGCDVVANPLTGFSNIDQYLLKIRNELRSQPGINPDDISNAMVLLSGIGNIAGQALRDAIFETGTSERAFQSKATEMLRNRSDIGESLQAHGEAAGGITDLSFHSIPLELKVEHKKALLPEHFSKYFEQAAAYAIGFGKRIAILSVLETSEKLTPIGVIEDDIKVFAHQSGQSIILIIVAVIRGGFPKPSSYSR
ncbi:hypothetical protein [Pseudomonas sp. NMS19W]|uniref:hypothetical protein n=1 Tax=Pseudomonas sp. NMS19W TaxID=3079768 RepID=UPI003F658211